MNEIRKFSTDKASGDLSEDNAAARLQQLNCKTEKAPEGYFPFWDLRSTASTHTISTYEVKRSNASNDRFCIELDRLQDDKTVPAGLSITTSDYYILQHHEDANLHIIPTHQLRQLIQNKEHLFQTYDQSGYRLAVFEREKLFAFCQVL